MLRDDDPKQSLLGAEEALREVLEAREARERGTVFGYETHASLTGPQAAALVDELRSLRERLAASDLAKLCEMLDRREIRYDRATVGDHVEVELVPPDVLSGCGEPCPNLRGDSWAETTFRFSADGELQNIEIDGD